MSTLGSRLRPTVDSPARTAGVAVGDALGIGIVVTIGMISHHGTAVLGDPIGVVGTALPFLLGWAACSLVAGAYDDAVLTSTPAAIRATAVGWIAAANLGLIMRGSPLFAGQAPWTFSLVITATVLAALVPWRALVAHSLGSSRTFRSA